MPSPRIAIASLLLLLSLPITALARRTSPVDGGVLTSGVGWRLDPFGSGKMVYHNGYDIAVPSGTPVHPVEAGTVYFAGKYKGYGEMVAVDHGNGYLTIYGHNSVVKVRAGDRVDSNTVIALSGSSGHSTGPHVHYEMREIPGYEKVRRAQLENSMKQLVQQKVDGWVQGYVEGKDKGKEQNKGLAVGGGEGFFLPDDNAE